VTTQDHKLRDLKASIPHTVELIGQAIQLIDSHFELHTLPERTKTVSDQESARAAFRSAFLPKKADQNSPEQQYLKHLLAIRTPVLDALTIRRQLKRARFKANKTEEIQHMLKRELTLKREAKHFALEAYHFRECLKNFTTAFKNAHVSANAADEHLEPLGKTLKSFDKSTKRVLAFRHALVHNNMNRRPEFEELDIILTTMPFLPHLEIFGRNIHRELKAEWIYLTEQTLAAMETSVAVVKNCNATAIERRALIFQELT